MRRTNGEKRIKNVQGYNGLYLVSDVGEIFSNYKRKSGVNLRGRISKKTGYLYVNLCINGEAKNKTIHRLVAKAFIPNPGNKPQVNHKDGDKQNNHFTNLEWCSNSENAKHAFKNRLLDMSTIIGFGRIIDNRGEKSGVSKLKNKQILEIRKKYKKGNRWNPSRYDAKKLSDEYNTTPNNILSIVNRKTWKHI